MLLGNKMDCTLSAMETMTLILQELKAEIKSTSKQMRNIQADLKAVKTNTTCIDKQVKQFKTHLITVPTTDTTTTTASATNAKVPKALKDKPKVYAQPTTSTTPTTTIKNLIATTTITIARTKTTAILIPTN